MFVDDRELRARAAQIETVLADVESFPDAQVRAKVADIVQGLLALYGEGLARLLAIVRQQATTTGDPSTVACMLKALAADELVSHLLLLHDLHPVDVATRVARALDDVRPYLQSHGGNVELVGVEEGVARLRLQGSCNGCPSSTATLKLAIEEAIWKAAPDLDGIEAEGVVAPIPAPDTLAPAAPPAPVSRPTTPTPATPTRATPRPAGFVPAAAVRRMERRTDV